VLAPLAEALEPFDRVTGRIVVEATDGGDPFMLRQ
jgi:hypothetical protein